MEKTDIRSLEFDELVKFCEKSGEKNYRAKQIYDWLHVKLVDSFDEMTNLPKELRAKLEQNFYCVPLRAVDVQISKIDGTRKYLFELHDENVIESVLMKYKHGYSVCISSQVGCRMGCKFCASTLDGLERGLAPSEMLGQIYQIQKSIGQRISNIVVMGTGEPFDNYDNLIKFIHMISDDKGLNISQRNITVSTCGIAPKIKEFADEGLAVTLALSLHASNNEKRKLIMPIAYKYSLEEVLSACDYFYDKTGRRVTFEYSLIGGVNDSEEDAEELIQMIKNRNCHINLIPVNPIKERDYTYSDKKVIDKFKNKLEKSGRNVTIRREMGRDIDGACGQLRKKHMDKSR